MIPALLAQIGLPLIARLAGAGLEALDNPAADTAARALREVDGVLRTGGVAPEALDAANRRIEAEARSREAETAWREVNATMRAETRAGDAYVRRWRPTFGYAVTAAWAMQMGAIAWAVVAHPTDAPAILAAAASLSAMWGVALAVLGVAVHERSRDKALAAGQPASGLASLAAALLDRRKAERPAAPAG